MTKTGVINIFLTNLGKYNEGDLLGEWVSLPISDEELEAVKNRIGINEYYEEYFITDYESNIDGLNISEYDSVERLNTIAEALAGMDEYDSEIVGAFLSEGYSLEDAIENKDDVVVWWDCSDMTDVAYAYIEETGMLRDVPDSFSNYFDYKAFGRDMSFDGQFVFTDRGNCVQIL